jgi:hypothetical protein
MHRRNNGYAISTPANEQYKGEQQVPPAPHLQSTDTGTHAAKKG